MGEKKGRSVFRERLNSVEQIHLLPEVPELSLQMLTKLFPRHRSLVVTDCVVQNDSPYFSQQTITSSSQPRNGRRQIGEVFVSEDGQGQRVFVFDHHGESPDVQGKDVTATTLVCDAIQAGYFIPDRETPVIIHHTDADAILSAAIAVGYLSPDLKYKRAAIAADHTGEQDPIAELLTSLEKERNIPLSLDALRRLERQEKQGIHVEKLLDQRGADRQRAVGLAQQATEIGHGVYYIFTPHMIESVLLVSHLPDATAIVIASEMGKDTWEIKVRAGMQFPEGCSLQLFDLPSFGCRCRAGNTRRHGGWNGDDPFLFAVMVSERIARFLPLESVAKKLARYL